MSVQTLQAIEDAIQAHLNELDDEPGTLTEWVVGYTRASIDSDGDVVQYEHSYCVSGGSGPAASLGLATLTLNRIQDDLMGYNAEDD